MHKKKERAGGGVKGRLRRGARRPDVVASRPKDCVIGSVSFVGLRTMAWESWTGLSAVGCC